MKRNVICKIEDGCPAWAEGLTDREQRFVSEYLIDLNARQAAIRAKLGKTPKSASEIASRMRRKQSVAMAISKLLAERAGVTGSRVIEELAKLALVDVTEFAQVKDGRLVVTNTADLAPDQRAAIVGVKETINEKGHVTIEYKFDKLGALDRLARALGLFKQHHEISGPNGGPVEIEDAVARLDAMVAGIAKRKQAEGGILSYELDPPVKRIAAPPIQQPVRIIDAE